MSEYIITCDVCEMERNSTFTTIPGEVEEGDLVLVEVEGWLIPGRLGDGDDLHLPSVIVDLSNIPYRILGRIVPITMENAYFNLN